MKRLGKLFGAAVLSLALFGCVAHDDPYVGKGDTVKPASEYFDFNIENKVDFNINYGSTVGSSLLEIYDEFPIVNALSDGSYELSGTPIYKVFTAADGKFHDSINIATSISKVYIYNGKFGAPTLVSADVDNKSVSCDFTASTASAKARTRTVYSDFTTTVIDESKNIYTFMTWSDYGKLDDSPIIDPELPDEYKDEIQISSDVLTAIQKTLWGGNTTKPHGLDNSQYIMDTKYVNTTIKEVYETEVNGVTELRQVKSAEVYFTFLTENGWNQNTMGYYYYPQDDVPSSPDGVKKFIIVPNASRSYSVPFDANENQAQYGYPYIQTVDGVSQAPMALDTRIQLLYQNDDGTYTTDFPAGYTIGFFLIPNGFQSSEDDRQPDFSNIDHIFYSNSEWNEEYQGNKARFISLNSANGIVYGCEDGEDKSYEDVLFTISANPNEAVQDPDRPYIDVDDNTITTEQVKTQIYAYEDIWPTGGDYDMNDVMVQHKRTIAFNNADGGNNVTSVIDEFTPVQPAGSATFNDAFAVQYTNRGNLTYSPETIIDETETSSLILFTVAKNVHNQTFTVTRGFIDSPQKSVIENEELNPYIIANYDGSDSRTEVHLPKKNATIKASAEQIGSADDAYYVDKDGLHPFAITVPDGFMPVTEKVSIETEYPYFTLWVSSKGTTNTDWYNYYQKSITAE